MALIKLYNNTPTINTSSRGIRLYKDVNQATQVSQEPAPEAMRNLTSFQAPGIAASSAPVQPEHQGFLRSAISGLKEQYTNPQPDILAAEKLAGVGKKPTNILERVTQPVYDLIQKAGFRTFGPMFDPVAKDIAEGKVANELIPKIESGELPQNTLLQFDTLQKTAPQIVGDVAQAVLAVYSPTFLKNNIVQGISSPVIKALVQGGIKGGEVGLGFGVAQALSSGSKKPSEIASIIAQSVGTMGILGAITAGILPVANDIKEQAFQIRDNIKQDLISKGIPEHEAMVQANHAGEIPQPQEGKFSLYPSKPGQEVTKPGEQPISETAQPAETIVKPQEGIITPPEAITPSGLAKSIEQKAIEAKLTKGFENVAGYEASTIKEQSQMVSDLINKGIDDVRKIVRGEEPLPEKMRGSSLILGVEEYLKKNPSEDLAYELANSPLVSKVSQAGSELGLMQNREPDSATAQLAALKQFREAKAEKVTKITKSQLTKDILTETNKVNLPKEELSWSKFIDKIQC